MVPDGPHIGEGRSFDFGVPKFPVAFPVSDRGGRVRRPHVRSGFSNLCLDRGMKKWHGIYGGCDDGLPFGMYRRV